MQHHILLEHSVSCSLRDTFGQRSLYLLSVNHPFIRAPYEATNDGAFML